jgi:hypothetical protein
MMTRILKPRVRETGMRCRSRVVSLRSGQDTSRSDGSLGGGYDSRPYTDQKRRLSLRNPKYNISLSIEVVAVW